MALDDDESETELEAEEDVLTRFGWISAAAGLHELPGVLWGRPVRGAPTATGATSHILGLSSTWKPQPGSTNWRRTWKTGA